MSQFQCFLSFSQREGSLPLCLPLYSYTTPLVKGNSHTDLHSRTVVTVGRERGSSRRKALRVMPGSACFIMNGWLDGSQPVWLAPLEVFLSRGLTFPHLPVGTPALSHNCCLGAFQSPLLGALMCSLMWNRGERTWPRQSRRELQVWSTSMGSGGMFNPIGPFRSLCNQVWFCLSG